MSMRERTRVGEVKYGFDLFCSEDWMFSGTRKASLHDHTTCCKEFPLQLTRHPSTGSKSKGPHYGGLQLGGRRLKEKGAVGLRLVSCVESRERQPRRLPRLPP